jgi:HEXXH motif-containing protein
VLAADRRAYFPQELDQEDSAQTIEGVRATLLDAVALIAYYAPHYLDWVGSVVRAVIPVKPPAPGGYSSSSDPAIHGVITISFPMSPMLAAESLIHEASHQYYHFAQLDTLFGNGQDTKGYWSPYLKRDRPIDRILLAYHAYKNVFAFLTACAEAGDAEAERALPFHRESLRGFRDALAKSPGLTAEGRAFFEAMT